MAKKKRQGQLKKEPQTQAAPLTGAWLHGVRALLVSAMIITSYLALVTLTNGGGAPGCGPDSGCDQVLTSSWAYWLGIPVSLPGLALYGVFLISTFSLSSQDLEKARRSLNAQTLCAFSVLFAAIWFVGVQGIKIKAFCPYCCTAHALASIAAILFLTRANSVGSKLSVQLNFAGGALAGVVLVAVVAFVQVAFPKKQAAPEIVNLAESNPEIETTNPPPAQLSEEEVTPQVISTEETQTPPENVVSKSDRPASPPLLIPRTNFQITTSGLPTLGDLTATHRITCIFDYTCHHCRNLHGFIRELLVKYDGQLSCLMIPMPLDADCNRLIKKTQEDHLNACAYAKVCLAVHQIAPEKYDAFDNWLFSNHESVKSVETVMEHARDLVGADELDKALQSDQLIEQLKTNITTYETTSKMGRKSSMPQTIIGSQVVFGPPPNVETLDRILKQILQLN